MRVLAAVRLLGGLGNQLFQLAAAYELEERGHRVVLDRSWFGAPTQDAPRCPDVLEAELGLSDVRLPRILSSRVGEGRWLAIESAPLDDVLSRVTRRPYVVHGYFQRADLALRQRERLTAAIASRIPRALASRAEPYVGVHVRLGDYLANPTVRRFHGLEPPLDILDAARVVAASRRITRIRVFTDSPDDLERLADTTDLELSDASAAWEVIEEMSLGDSLVMSNSSLSWWGAVVGSVLSERGQHVVIPRPWFAEASPMDDLLLVEGWSTRNRRLEGRLLDPGV